MLFDFTLTNTSTSACTVTGYPGVTWVAGADGHPVGSPATRSGDQPQTVTLQPRSTAVSHARFARAANYPADRCRPVHAEGFRVSAPGLARGYFVPHPGTACSSTQVRQLAVRPFGTR